MQRDVYQLLIPVLKTQMQKAVKLHYRHLHLLHLLMMKIQGLLKIQTQIRILKQEIQTQEMMMAVMMEEMAAAMMEEMAAAMMEEEMMEAEEKNNKNTNFS